MLALAPAPSWCCGVVVLASRHRDRGRTRDGRMCGYPSMKRFADLLACIAALLALLGCGGSAKGDELRALDVGYGPADTWHLLSPSLVDEMAANGLRFLVTEHRPSVQVADWRKGERPRSFPEEARAWNEAACERGLTHIVFGLNWNMKPLRSLTDEEYTHHLNEILSIYDPACTWLEPLVEPDEGDPEKRRRWTQLAADAWPGKLLMPAAIANLPIRRDFVDFHPSSVLRAEELLRSGTPNLLVITDGGPFVFPPAILPDIRRLARISVETGIPFIVYADRYGGSHEEIIREIGAGASEATLP